MGFLHSIYKSFFINSSLQPATESDRSTCTRKGHDTSHPSCSPKGDAPTCSYKSSPLPQNTSTGCPFGFSSTRCDDIDDVERDEEVQNAGVSSTGATTFTPPLSGRNRVVLLYEHYIHLPALRAVWESPITERPELEPCFSAACHGMEIGYLLLAHFLTDQRTYVQKRSRVELVMEDLMRQYSLLAELVDGELEEEGPLDQCVRDGHAQPPTRGSGSPAPRPPQLLPSCSPSSPAFSLGAATDGSEDGSPTSFTETDSSSGSHLRTQGMGNPPSPSGGKTGGDKTDIPGGERPTSRSWGFPVPIKEEGSDQEAPVRLQPPRPLSSLTQDFPFPCCPPTSTVGARSPSLDLLLEALAQSLPAMTPSERVSVTKVIRNITHALDGASRAWSVGLGIEGQMNELRALVSLAPLASFQERESSSRHLDYARLIRPEVVVATYRDYPHTEDFFFRSVHLGTDCWAFTVIRRLQSARVLATGGDWYTASARVRQAAHILCYLGEHVMMLTSMVLRDYLELKVQIEGTSGEGSSLVRSFRPYTKRLMEPLEAALLRLPLSPARAGISTGEGEGVGEGEGEGEDDLQQALLAVYEFPEAYPALYAYIKALERVESALLGGFYFNHFRLAVNVIGGEARGTMNRAVAALQSTRECCKAVVYIPFQAKTSRLYIIRDHTRQWEGDGQNKHLNRKKSVTPYTNRNLPRSCILVIEKVSRRKHREESRTPAT
ncbi:nematode resistance hs1pro1 protein [Nannochloropsis gaditana]|uniref:Nematode resistance hs1pro1 protein n=1 Tax=Nannochloropsis gaditana TaxID=72520 RepID=W7TK22_9STRA|nr:nematode resistance hs1pro1 protein [Nannochloropsis gaditana]